MQPVEEHSSKLHLSKTLNGTVYFMWSNKKNTHAESVSELAYGYKRTVSCESARLDHMKKEHI